MIRTVLIDDEPPARRKLRHLLAGETDISIVGEASSGVQAVELLNRMQPDLAFLDVQLPDCTGFDVVESCQSRPNLHLVFVTAHDHYALKAFEVSAVDYLLKPVEPSRFTRSLSRIRQRLQVPTANLLSTKLEQLEKALQLDRGYARRLLIQEGDRSFFLDVRQIDSLESARNYVCVYSGNRTYLLRSSLDAVAAKLPPDLFQRINRSEIINRDQVAEVRSWFHGDQKVILKNGKELNWTRRYRTGSLGDWEKT